MTLNKKVKLKIENDPLNINTLNSITKDLRKSMMEIKTEKIKQSNDEKIANILLAKSNEYIQLCEDSINHNHCKSTIYANLFMGIEMYIKREITLEGLTFANTHDLNLLGNRNRIFDRFVLDYINSLMKKDKLSNEAFRNIRYNFLKDKIIILEKDIANINFKGKVLELIKWIKRNENLKNEHSNTTIDN